MRNEGPKAFTGTIDPAVVEEWLRGTERILDRFDCTAEKKVSYASSFFEQDALDWWETIPGSRNVPMTMTWNEFGRVFTEKYTPVVYRDRKKIEFSELKQGDLFVAEYEIQFVQLSKYAPEEIATEELKRNKFERGLNLDIREKMAIKPSTYREVLETALGAEEMIIKR